jgi:hypothetical protein
MKMSREDYRRLQDALFVVLPPIRDPAMYGTRQRWEALWAAADRGLINVNELYSHGLNDDHIDTALRHITGR